MGTSNPHKADLFSLIMFCVALDAKTRDRTMTELSDVIWRRDVPAFQRMVKDIVAGSGDRGTLADAERLHANVGDFTEEDWKALGSLFERKDEEDAGNAA